MKLLTSFLLFCLSFSTDCLFAQKPLSDSGFIEVDGSKLRYVMYGKGEPCLVIGSSIYYPRTFSKELNKSLKLYFVDMKWFAPEYAPENLDSLTINSIVADVEEIRQKLHLAKPLLMGHSIHGSIAMEYAKQHPEEISGLIMIGSPCDRTITSATYDSLWEKTASAERKKILKENMQKLQQLESKKLTTEEAVVADYNASAPQMAYNPKYNFSWLWNGMTIHQDILNALFGKAFRKYKMFDPEVKVTVPTFLAVGKYDLAIYAQWNEVKAIPIQDFTKVVFDKSGHTPQLEESKRFDDELLNWINSKVK